MKLLSRFNVSKDSGGPRKFSFEISMSGVISVGIVVVLGMCWVFILGILVGRGYKPETAVPQIAQMMPTTEAAQPDGAASTTPPTVLKPEELQFMEGLHEGKEAGEVVTDSTQKSPADGKKAEAKATPMGSAQAPTAIPPHPTPVAAAAPVKPAPATKTPAKPASAKHAEQPASAAKAAVEPKSPFDKKAGGRYVATYQVASFPSKEQAEAMIKNLSRKGISASVQQGTSGNRTVFRVKVQLKGTESEITQGLKRTGEKGPILLGKKPL